MLTIRIDLSLFFEVYNRFTTIVLRLILGLFPQPSDKVNSLDYRYTAKRNDNIQDTLQEYLPFFLLVFTKVGLSLRNFFNEKK